MYRNHGHETASRRQRIPPRTAATTDFGGMPFVVDITKATLNNNTFRTALWSGTYLQLTLMRIDPGDDIGLEDHSHIDQFLCIQEGWGLVQMGDNKDNLRIVHPVYQDTAIFVPAGTWHNLTNTGDIPLMLYSIYAPPSHPFSTVHQTKEIAEASDH